MLTEDLVEHILIKPATAGKADKLLVVSGYATANMYHSHRSILKEMGIEVSVELVVGMTPVDGIIEAQHKAFQSLRSKKFSCNYLPKNKAPCHAKVYVWLRQGKAVQAFSGSANYTVTAFKSGQQEAMASVDPKQALAFYRKVKAGSVPCASREAQQVVRLPGKESLERVDEQESVLLPLVTRRTGETHNKAGLNWGQRPGRDPDQAYIPIPSNLRHFFPPKAEPFTAATDDGHTFTMVVAQMDGKALHTPDDNSELGRYFRGRLGLVSGQKVTKDHLAKYGRFDVRFTRIDEETFEMDFSRPSKK